MSNSSEILISISTNLATIFALIFTGATVLVQIVKRGYKTIDIIFRNKNILFVFLFFVIAITYPLIILIPDNNILSGVGIGNETVAELSITTSISFMIFGVLVLIPYSFEFFKIIKFNAILQLKKDSESAIKEIENDKKADLEDIIIDLSDLGVMVTEYYDEYHMTYIINELKKLGFKTVEKEWVDETFMVLTGLNKIGSKIVETTTNEKVKCEEFNRYYASEALNALRDVGLKAVEKRLYFNGTANIPVAFNAIDDISKIGIKAVENNISKLSEDSLNGILKIGIKATENYLEMSRDPLGFLNETRDSLIKIGTEADKKDNLKDITEKSMQSLWVLSAFIQKYKLDPDVEVWADELNKKLNELKLHNKNANILFQNEVDNTKKIRPDLANEIDSFKETYDAYCNRTP